MAAFAVVSNIYVKKYRSYITISARVNGSFAQPQIVWFQLHYLFDCKWIPDNVRGYISNQHNYTIN